jgi:CheY-like chemotaxis protein
MATPAAIELRDLTLMFEVEDTGAGIAAEDQERIFESFVRVGKTTEKGTGLGLAITRQFLQLMGGAIRLESTPGKGSTFRVEVPVARAEEFEAVTPLAGSGRIIGLEPRQAECRVLIVEDEKENSALLDRLLDNAGFAVRLAADGTQGVELFREWRPHFIWMDLRMPAMDGFEAVRRIRALEGGLEVKIAAVTASVFEGQRNEVLAAGFDDFIRKPYRPEAIFDCMARQLGVRYCRDASPPATTGDSHAADLSALPEELRKDLASAVISLDRALIAGVIGRVAELDAALGVALVDLADRFAYTAILSALESCQSKPAAGSQ